MLAGAGTLQARRSHGGAAAPPADEEAAPAQAQETAAAESADADADAPPPRHGALARAPSLVKDVHGRDGFHAPRGRQLSFSLPLLQARARPAPQSHVTRVPRRCSALRPSRTACLHAARSRPAAGNHAACSGAVRHPAASMCAGSDPGLHGIAPYAARACAGRASA
jgi:hypothetical protein